jgi:hypothetical protein
MHRRAGHLEFLLDALALNALQFRESSHVLPVHLVLRLLLPSNLGLLGFDQSLLSRATSSLDLRCFACGPVRNRLSSLLLHALPLDLCLGTRPCRLLWVTRLEKVPESNSTVYRWLRLLEHVLQLPRACFWVKRPNVLEDRGDLLQVAPPMCTRCVRKSQGDARCTAGKGAVCNTCE